MIRKTLLTTLVMLVLYQVAVPHFSRRYYVVQGYQRQNFLKAQNYVFDAQEAPKLIVGSSMTGRLPEDVLGPSYTKLDLAGGNPWTDLEIVQRAGKKPEVLLIEINLVVGRLNEDLVSDLFNPTLFELRRHFSMFREEDRPSNFAAGIGEVGIRKIIQTCTCLALGHRPAACPVHGQRVNPALYAELLKLEHSLNEKPPDPDLLAKQVSRMAQYVETFRESGTKCIFFEMPYDPSISKLAAPTAVRMAAEKQFPRSEYHWLQLGRPEDYTTTDVIHLAAPDAARLASLLVTQVDQIVHDDKQARR